MTRLFDAFGRPVTRVLFVDSDLSALSRIEQAMKLQSVDWEMRFTTNGTAALAELEFHGVADVVVANLDMPMMDGVTLLSSIKAQFPNVVRILISDFRNLSATLRAVPVAHQFLSTPIEPVALTVAVERTIETNTRISEAPLRASLGDIDALPSPPQTLVELSRVLSRADTSANDVAEVIENDTAMTAKLLQMVNSAVFGLQYRITNVRQACAYLGVATVRNLMMAVEMTRALIPRNSDLTRAAEQLHVHSLAVGDLARSFLQTRAHAHDAFAAGVMHDIGLLALMHMQPERYLELQHAVTSGNSLADCELSIVGARHSDIGAHLLNLWGLPFSLVEAVARSHDADLMSDRILSPVHAVYAAEQVINMSKGTGASWENGELPDSTYLSEIGLSATIEHYLSGVSA